MLGERRPYLHITADRNSFLHISQLIRKLGSECRVSHDAALLEQRGLRVFLMGPTVIDCW